MPYTGYISTKKNQGNPRLLEVQDHCAKTRTMSQRQPCASEPCLAELLQYLPGWSRNRLPRFPQFHSHMDRKFIRFCLIFECLPHDSYGKKKQTTQPCCKLSSLTRRTPRFGPAHHFIPTPPNTLRAPKYLLNSG